MTPEQVGRTDWQLKCVLPAIPSIQPRLGSAVANHPSARGDDVFWYRLPVNINSPWVPLATYLKMQLPAVCVTAGAKTQTIASIGIVHVREHFQFQ